MPIGYLKNRDIIEIMRIVWILELKA